MDLYKEILAKVFEREKIHVIFPNLKISAAEIIDIESYRALQKIKAVIEDDSLSDEFCFLKIEEIVCAFEALGSDGGGRHDY